MEIVSYKKRCAYCGNKSEQRHIIGEPEGYPDLDGKPPFTVLRGAMSLVPTVSYGIELCPHCHYANTDIEEAVCQPGKIGRIMRTVDYKMIGHLKRISNSTKAYMLARIFYDYQRENETAAYMALKASWCSMDCDGEDFAPIARSLAIDYFKLCPDLDSEKNLIIVDLLRQEGQFGYAEEMADRLLRSECEPKYIAYLKYEKTLCDKWDRAPHSRGEIWRNKYETRLDG